MSSSSLKAFADLMRGAAQAALQIDDLLTEAQLTLHAATCAEIMPRFYQMTSIFSPDVTDQPPDIRRAVRSYEKTVQELNQAIPPVQKVCDAGGGLPDSSELEEMTSAVRWASGSFWWTYLAVK